MLTTHKVENISAANDVNNPCFILTNKTGGYLSLSPKPISRYQGAFFFEKNTMFKAVSNIIPEGCGDIRSIKNKFHSIERERGDNELNETFTMPLYHNSVIYETDKEAWLEIIMDSKKSYDNRSFGRYYRIFEEEDKIIIEFTKKTDKREDSTEGKIEYRIYTVINRSEFEKKGIFTEESYSFDEHRKSWPWTRHVYSALRIKSKKLVISFSTDKKKAISDNNNVLNRISELKAKQEIYVNGFKKRIKDQEKMIAYKAACLSLDSLVVNINNKRGIFAGLWWFFQFWTRDEAISLKALMQQQKYDVAKDILFRQLSMLEEDGTINNFYPKSSKAKNADSIGWLMKRVYDFIKELEDKKIVSEYLSHDEIESIKLKVEECIYGLIDKSTHEDLAHNESNETWMDTNYGGDDRKGYRIEIQALRLNIYKLMRFLCELTKDKVGKDIAEKLEKDLKERVVKQFWNGKYLDDGLNDKTIRPNMFIAYYIYPELLTNSRWIDCFREAIRALWSEWGGFATIDKTDKLYCTYYTGEDNKSYHRGDSWFWINNLAAICMSRVSRFRFGDYIDKIADASTKEILWKGAIGHHAELSSSIMPDSEGCLMQAWSAAMYIEMMNELY